MHFNEFLQLNETEQVELLWYNGEQIGRRKENDYLILLYQVEGFYVEVFYHRKDRVIKRYTSFDCSDRRLEAYLEKIDISPIYKQIRRPSRYLEHRLLDYYASRAAEKSYDEKQVSCKQPKSWKRGLFQRLISLFRR